MKWRPIENVPPEAKGWTSETYRYERERWHDAREALAESRSDSNALELWRRERNRLFALETGQIESLYTMRPGITETLITEGLENARASHTIEERLDDDTLRGLLTDQESAIDMVFETIKDVRPLSEGVIKEWHALLTRHQESAPARDPMGHQIEIPFLKGAYKRRPNNPRTAEGTVHEYCPPEHTASEMERLLRMHHAHQRAGDTPTPVEAAWLHHRFVQIHPFEDGNGRCARLLMSYVFAKAGEPVPIITAADKANYFDLLSEADAGDLKPFAMDLDLKATAALRFATRSAERALLNRPQHHHANGERSTRLPDGRWRRERGSLRQSVLDIELGVPGQKDVPEPDQPQLRIAPTSRAPHAGPAYPDVAPVYRSHPDKIPTLAGTEEGTVLFGLSTLHGDVTVLYTVREGEESAFIEWMKDHHHLWGDPFGNPDDLDAGLQHAIARRRERAKEQELK